MTGRKADIPGFVDLQVNGFAGIDFSGSQLTESDVAKACDLLLERGTVAFLPTVITSPMELYERNLPLIAKSIQAASSGSRPLGIHLEGPFLSGDEGARGVHNPSHMREPDVSLLDRLQELAGGSARLLTISADLPHADKLAAHAVEIGIAVSLGHHMANEQHLRTLAGAGASALTHLGNGVPARLPRHDNPIWAGLAVDELTAMIVTDGSHLPPPVIKTIVRTKGVSRVAITSDSSPLAGLSPGDYTSLGRPVTLDDGGTIRDSETGYLAGSSATMVHCMNHLASLGLLSPDELLLVGFHNPLGLLGLEPSALDFEPCLYFDEAKRSFVAR